MNDNWLCEDTTSKASTLCHSSHSPIMPRSQLSHRRHSASFTKFVTRLQHTFSSKNKASTPIVQPPLFTRPAHPAPVSNETVPRFHHTVQSRSQPFLPSAIANSLVVVCRKFSTILIDQWNISVKSTRDHIRTARSNPTWLMISIPVTTPWVIIAKTNSTYHKWMSAWTTTLISNRAEWNFLRRQMLLGSIQQPSMRWQITDRATFFLCFTSWLFIW